MTSLRLTIAAYDSLALVTAAWDQMSRQPPSTGGPLDAVLIERFDRRVTTLHRCWPTGWARGWLASALVGRLSPPALLDGALAGGVGRRTLTLVTDRLSPADATELSATLDARRFILVMVEGEETNLSGTPSRNGASTTSTAVLACTIDELRRAVQADQTEE